VKHREWIILFVLGIVLVFSNIAVADRGTLVSEADVDAVIKQAQTELTELTELQKQSNPQGDASAAIGERSQRKMDRAITKAQGRMDRAITKAQMRIDSALECKERGILQKAMSEAKHALNEIKKAQKKMEKETQKQGGKG
jgi:predicted RND superfamily exporter protein